MLRGVHCMPTWREHYCITPRWGDENRPSRTVVGLASGPGVLVPKPPASKQARLTWLC